MATGTTGVKDGVRKAADKAQGPEEEHGAPLVAGIMRKVSTHIQSQSLKHVSWNTEAEDIAGFSISRSLYTALPLLGRAAHSQVIIHPRGRAFGLQKDCHVDGVLFFALSSQSEVSVAVAGDAFRGDHGACPSVLLDAHA